MTAASMNKALWYADGLRWIGSVFNDAAEQLERTAAETSAADPRVVREIEEHLNQMRTRVHTSF
jgi:hypothetical protein